MQNLKNITLVKQKKTIFKNSYYLILYREFAQDLVFKGGTALTKCYGFNRFSEDLDFNFDKNYDLKKFLSKRLKYFDLDFEIEKKIFKQSDSIVCIIKGPLYNGHSISICKISIDINYRDKVILKPNIKELGAHISKISIFKVFVIDEQEILAEKIRAIYTRNSARDLYDLFYLLKKEIKPNLSLINEKLSLYDLNYSKNIFMQKIILKQKIWKSEMKNLTLNFPDFKDVYNFIEINFENLSKNILI